MSELLLNSLEIKNFRCFEHLTIEKLGRVNLIVGKNSVGKTALLEALRLYAAGGNPFVIDEILQSRDESAYTEIAYMKSDEMTKFIESFQHLYYDRQFKIGESCIVIGVIKNDERTLKIEINYFTDVRDTSSNLIIMKGPIPVVDYALYNHLYPRLTLNTGSRNTSSISIPPTKGVLIFSKNFAYHFIPINGMNIRNLSQLWDITNLSGNRAVALQALKTIVASLEDVNLVGASNEIVRSPIFIAKLNGQKPIPLSSLGEGLVRAFAISLALANSQNGFLFIDEFETGLHHSVQKQMWELILNKAKELNIQVFATTHSWDCVEAFQQVAVENEGDEAMLIRLQRRKSGDGIVSILYDKEDLTIVTEDNIEVR